MSAVSLPNHESSAPSKAWTASLWAVQILLAAAFGMAGVMKTTLPIDQLAAKMVWPGALPPGLVRFIGASELTAALGLILPSLTRIKPVLTPVAAIGLDVIMLLALAFHATRGELHALPVNLTLGGLAAFVAWGRLKKAVIR
jgi:putative oxidoreductase